jgi:hypothetical protein
MSIRVAIFDTTECPYREAIRGYPDNCWKRLDANGNLTECSEENCPLPKVIRDYDTLGTIVIDTE